MWKKAEASPNGGQAPLSSGISVPFARSNID